MLTESMQYEKKSYTKKWSGKGKTTVNREPRTVNRGRLASLMSEDAKATASIHELSYDFACRIEGLVDIEIDEKDDITI